MDISECRIGNVVKITPSMRWPGGGESHYGIVDKIDLANNFVYVLVSHGGSGGHVETKIQCDPAELSPDKRQ